MISKIKRVEVFRKTVSLTTGLTKVEVPPDQMPSGLIRRFKVRLISAAITNFGSATSDWQKILNLITYGSAFPKHMPMQAVPGKYWDKIWTLLKGVATTRTTPTANGFAIQYYLPFCYEGTKYHPAYRAKDTGLLNINNKALPFLTLHLGPYTDLSSAATACDVTVVVEAEYEPIVRPGFDRPDNPLLSGDQPIKMIELLLQPKADLSVAPIMQFTTGPGRELIMAFMRELNGTTETSDMFTGGVATPSKMVFRKGDNDEYNSDQKVESLDAEMSDYFGIALTAGCHAFVPAKDGRLSDAIDISSEKFQCAMDNLATYASRQQEWAVLGTIDLPEAVKKVHAQQLGVTA